METTSLNGLPSTHIGDVFVRPDTRRKCISVVVDAPENSRILLAIEETPFSTEGAPGELTVDFPDFEWWSTETPRSYSLRCECMQDGEAVDCVQVRFGMREFTIKEDRFYLNRRPVFVKGVDWEPSARSPDGGSDVASDLRSDLERPASFSSSM